MHKTCTCVGSGDAHGCSREKTCKMELPTMEDIGKKLRNKYEKSVHSKLISKSGHLDGKIIVDRENELAVKSEDMIHFISSPDYCKPSPSYNIKGVVGRECTRNASKASHQNHCDNLCCGSGSEEYIVQELNTCNCTFVWCCRVKCETCIKDVTKYRCL